MASATWLANPSLRLTIFLPMVSGDSGLISSKRWSSLCRSGIAVYKLLVVIIASVYGGICVRCIERGEMAQQWGSCLS